MRTLITLACAAALLACSDANAPTAVKHSHQDPADPAWPAESLQTFSRLDPRPITDRLAALMSRRLAKVALPADNFSLSSDAVHPDMACPPRAWNGAACWLMYTPYKNSDNTYENPGFLVAASDTVWGIPPAVTNPIVPFPGIGMYNSDPDHAFDPQTGRLIQVYRVVADSFNKIMIMSTADGRAWSPARVAFKERSHDAVSPALVIDADRSARVWYVRAGAEGCSAGRSTVVLRSAQPAAGESFDKVAWSDPTPVDLSIPSSVVWHLDIAALPGGAGYVALVVAYRQGSTCGNSDLWLATSPDGLHWRTFAMPILWRSMKTATDRNISTWYRGTLRYDPATDSLHLWPSALAGAAWSVYHTTVKMTELFELLNLAQPSDYRAAFSRRAVAPPPDIPMP